MVSLKGILPNMNDIALAAGAAVSGTVTGYVKGVIPIELEFLPGMTEFLVGIGLGKFVLKKGIGRQFAKGIAIAGLSNMIASFIPQFSGTFPSAQKMPLQVNGARQAYSGLGTKYLHRNPVMGETSTETLIAPKGTRTMARAAGIRAPY